ncbi:response regulator transcription factor, partial [Nocardioides sp.]|uniref:winged helix-turn-helix domain-containing protein n=1 Tax=Nocardioides sp. TaxID=35761 RepID=UPI002EDA10F1
EPAAPPVPPEQPVQPVPPAQPAPQPYAPPPTEPIYQQPHPYPPQPGYQQPAQQPYPPAQQPHPPAQPVPQQPAAPVPQQQDGWVRFNGLALNAETRVVTVNGASVDLTRTEFDLLASLLSTGRRVRSKADLVLTMRGQQYVTSYFVNEADKRSVEVHIANLRRKIGDDAATPRYIETVRGVGYRLAEAA